MTGSTGGSPVCRDPPVALLPALACRTSRIRVSRSHPTIFLHFFFISSQFPFAVFLPPAILYLEHLVVVTGLRRRRTANGTSNSRAPRTLLSASSCGLHARLPPLSPPSQSPMPASGQIFTTSALHDPIVPSDVCYSCCTRAFRIFSLPASPAGIAHLTAHPYPLFIHFVFD